jgi:hypothetical protein
MGVSLRGCESVELVELFPYKEKGLVPNGFSVNIRSGSGAITASCISISETILMGWMAQ